MVSKTLYKATAYLSNSSWAENYVITYKLSPKRKDVVFDFFRLVWSMDDSNIHQPPIGQAYSFTQELRLLNRSTACEKLENENQEIPYIHQRLQEAFGREATTNIRRLKGPS